MSARVMSTYLSPKMSLDHALGPGTEPLELPNHAMAQLLGECVVHTEYVILNPKPRQASGEAVWWEMVNIRDFVEGLGENGP
jgi:hypothetical protein